MRLFEHPIRDTKAQQPADTSMKAYEFPEVMVTALDQQPTLVRKFPITFGIEI